MNHQRSRLLRALLAAASFLLISWALLAASASAALTHPFASQFATSCEPGDIDDIAVEETNGYVYVACGAFLGEGYGSRVIRRFHLNGTPAPFTASEPYLEGNKILYNPAAFDHDIGYGFVNHIAVDNSGGSNNGAFIMLGDKSQGGTLAFFKPSGEWYAELPVYLNVCVCGVDVGSNGHIYVGVSNRIAEYDEGFHELGRIYNDFGGGNGDEYVKADSTGAVWYASATFGLGGGSELRKVEHTAFGPYFNVLHQADAEELGLPFAPEPSPFVFPDPFVVDNVRGFDVDPTDDDILVNRGNRVEVFSNGDAEELAYKDGPNFGEGTLTGSSQTLAITDSREVYVAQGDNIVKFASGQILPDMVTRSPEIDDVGHTEAVVTGRVDRSGGPEITTCEFEYGTSQSYGNSVPCTSTETLPYSGSSTEVTATLPGLATGTAYSYRVHAGNANGTNNGVNRTVTPVAVVKLHTKPATGLEPHHATLNGSFDPDNSDTNYYFEYGLDAEYGQRTQMADAGSTPGVKDVAVDLDGLPSGKTFHYRVVAVNELGTTYGTDESFRTASPPDVAGVTATEVLNGTATLNARIAPTGYDTTYQFEYGTTPSYGSVVPQPDEDIGAGVGSQAVSQHIADLQSDVTYHFRVVATNQWGTRVSPDTTFDFAPPSCPNGHVRQQTGSSYLPDCRAYELVSPENAGSILMQPSDAIWGVSLSSGCAGTGCLVRYGNLWTVNTGLATSPARFTFYAGWGGIEGLYGTNSVFDLYMATRTNTGWVTTLPGSTGKEALLAARHRCSDSMEMCIDHNDGDPIYHYESVPVETQAGLYNWKGQRMGVLPTNVNSVPGGGHEIGNQYGDEALSGDFAHFAFSKLNYAFAPGGVVGAPGSAYDNQIADKTVTIISKTSAGSDIPQERANAPREYIEFPAISGDGSHILMQVKGVDGPVHLYLRVDDAITYDITQGDAKFIGMTRNGSKVIFDSARQLTSDDTDHSLDIYRWEEGESGGTLTRLSQGNGAGNDTSCGPSWAGSAGCGAIPLTTERGNPFGFVSVPAIDDYIASNSGDAYFYSPESLDPERPGIKDARNLYVYRNGAARLVATLDPGTEIDRMQISPDGAHAGFLTAANLTGYDSHGYREMYAYDADTSSLLCASCRPDGLPPTASVTAGQSGPFMSNDGRVFFNTKDSLVARDVDEGIIDVYEFVGGRPQLISSGTGSRDFTGGSAVQNILELPKARTGLESVSADGTDVYFSTYDSLVPQDHNGAFIKFYDARTGGGFDSAPEFAPCAAADECHGPGNPTPAVQGIGTEGELGATGNARPPSSKKGKHGRGHKKKRHGRRHGRRHGNGDGGRSRG